EEARAKAIAEAEAKKKAELDAQAKAKQEQFAKLAAEAEAKKKTIPVEVVKPPATIESKPSNAELEAEEKARLELSKKMTALEKERFLSELVQKYPEGVTKEIIAISSNFTITRFVVIKNKQATEYKKVKTRTATFYKENGLDLTELVYKMKTKEFDK
ncbi:MAG: hypothetical protein ACK5D8_04250, partial [Bacteroidota bacterium]